MKKVGLFFILFLFSCGTNSPASPTPVPTATPSPSSRPSGSPNETVCGSITLPGIDVSDAQLSTNWAIVTGQSFVFVKATEGTDFVSPTFDHDWAAVKQVGITRGPYHYFHPSEDPLLQSSAFLRAVGQFEADDLAPMLDWEVTDSMVPAVNIAAAQVWLAEVEAATGRVPIIYTGPSFWNALGNPSQFAHYPLFIANYDVVCPEIPPPWNTWLFWQHGTGPINGISSDVDLDWFNGNQLNNP